jgi:hypothetical protein
MESMFGSARSSLSTGEKSQSSIVAAVRENGVNGGCKPEYFRPA